MREYNNDRKLRFTLKYNNCVKFLSDIKYLLQKKPMVKIQPPKQNGQFT